MNSIAEYQDINSGLPEKLEKKLQRGKQLKPSHFVDFFSESVAAIQSGGKKSSIEIDYTNLIGKSFCAYTKITKKDDIEDIDGGIITIERNEDIFVEGVESDTYVIIIGKYEYRLNGSSFTKLFRKAYSMRLDTIPNVIISHPKRTKTEFDDNQTMSLGDTVEISMGDAFIAKSTIEIASTVIEEGSKIIIRKIDTEDGKEKYMLSIGKDNIFVSKKVFHSNILISLEREE